jgi:dynein light intermediate chain
VTLTEQERGLLLLRVRDEIKMTIAAYQTLYQSSVTFAMRKQIQSEEGQASLDNKIKEYEERRQRQADKIIELNAKIDAINRRQSARNTVDLNH